MKFFSLSIKQSIGRVTGDQFIRHFFYINSLKIKNVWVFLCSLITLKRDVLTLEASWLTHLGLHSVFKYQLRKGKCLTCNANVAPE